MRAVSLLIILLVSFVAGQLIDKKSLQPNKSLIVLSNKECCIITRSTEAKVLVIKMGEPYFKAKDIILKNKVYVFSSNYSLYGDLSRRVMRTLKRFNPVLEIYSIDEAFLDLTNYPNDEIEDVGKEIGRAHV